MALADSAIGTQEAAGDRDLLSALAGLQAGRDRDVAQRTRQVVMASLGVVKEQQAGGRRTKAMAVASLLLVVLALGPFVWRVVDDLIGGEHLSDIATQFSLLMCLFCPALLAAVLVAGWMRGRQ